MLSYYWEQAGLDPMMMGMHDPRHHDPVSSYYGRRLYSIAHTAGHDEE